MTPIQYELQTLLNELISGLGLPSDVDVVFDFPSDRTRGDIATPVAMALAKKVGQPPLEIAQRLADGLHKIANKYIAKVEVAGAGYLNMYLSDDFFKDSLRLIINEGSRYGNNDLLAGKRALFEYTDPNAFKEFHIGHLMSNTIGEALSRIAEASGAEVTRLCYQSDVGLNIAKAIWGMFQSIGSVPNDHDPLSERIAFLGRSYVLGSRQYEDDPDAKAEMDSLNQTIFARSDARTNELYDKGRAWSLEHFQEIFRLLGTKFDHLYYESEMAAPGLAIVREWQQKGVFEESDGAVIYRGEADGLHTRVFINKFGLPTYEAKDLALAADKAKRFPHDISIVMTGNEQDGYFKVMKAALKKIDPETEAKLTHVSHGMLRFTDGKMSSRKGNVITGESLIEEMRETVSARMTDRITDPDAKAMIRDAVAVGAIKYAILRQTTGKDIIFDPEKSLSIEGDSGPYLQYACARAFTLFKKAEESNITTDMEAWVSGEIYDVDRLLFQFSQIVKRAMQERAPQLLVTYLTTLAAAFNSFYATTPIISSGTQAGRRLVSVRASMIVLRNGMRLLGMTPLDQM
jgi:arginyl-tRNA synthetase